MRQIIKFAKCEQIRKGHPSEHLYKALDLR